MGGGNKGAEFGTTGNQSSTIPFCLGGSVMEKGTQHALVTGHASPFFALLPSLSDSNNNQ